MVRKDPDTAYLWPDRDGDLTVRLTMRQAVGQVRDKVASAGCDAGLENDLTTVLEALPR